MSGVETRLKIFYFFARPFQRLPMGFHYTLGRVFTFVAKNILNYRRDEIMTNLARSFPEKKYKELVRIKNGFYDHIGEIFAEAMWLGGCVGRPERLRDSGLVTAVEPDEFMETFSRKNVMALESHFGNWELIGGFLQFFRNYPPGKITVKEEDICVVYKQLSSPFWDEVCRRNRCAVLSKDFAGYLESKKVLRYALEHRAEKKLYVFPTDQFPYKGAARHEIPSFMNQPTQVMCGGASLARKFGMAVFMTSSYRLEKGRYELRFTKICEDASQLSVGEIMEKYYEALEREVVENPTNYLWSHKRWK